MEKKPLGMAIEDFTANLISQINSSGIPAYVMELILFKVQASVNEAKSKQLVEEQKEFDAQAEENATKDKED